MKTPLGAAFAFVLLRSAFAADPEALLFGSERIGVPPLSLSVSIATLTTLSQPGQFDRFLPGYSTRANSTSLSPSLIPLTGRPSIMQLKQVRPARSPYVSREHGMPILVPGNAVDYKMTIVPPDPSVDFKLVIKHPTHTRKRASAN